MSTLTSPNSDSARTQRRGVRLLTDLLPPRSDWEAARRAPGRNILAGITVAIVALPLALAFGVTSGLGAQAGLATAVVAGAIAAVLGGSNLQVSGPTGAMTVVLVPIVHEFGPTGVLMVGLMAGVLLLALAAARLGRVVHYLPMPVVEGFTAGIAVVIALQQVPAALGVDPGSHAKVWASALEAARAYVGQPDLAPPAITVAVVAVMLLGARRWPGFPFSLVGVVGATLAVQLLSLDVALLSDLPAGLPAPSADFVDLGVVGVLLPSALAVAALAALESLLSATVADAMSVEERHDPDRELFGQGVANLVTPFFGGIPATAAIARTAVNVRAGATSKLAALTHAVVLLVVVLALAPAVTRIPLAALAGVLIATAVRMVEVAALRSLARATRGDAAVLVLTFGVTVLVDLVVAVAVGVALAVVIALRAVAQSARLQQVPVVGGDHTDEEQALLAEHIVAFRIEGPLFFAAAHRFLLELTGIADVRVVILRMARVTTLDATGARVLGDAISRLESRGIVVLISGITAGHDGVLERLGVAGHLRREGLVHAGTREAIDHARRLLAADPTARRA